ncbi:MAG: hypothetical protein R2827_00905 [Bdellovibrionales bacterium]
MSLLDNNFTDLEAALSALNLNSVYEFIKYGESDGGWFKKLHNP